MWTSLVPRCVSLSSATFCGQVRTGADKSGSWVSILVGRHLADMCGQVRTSLVPGFLLLGGHLADMCRQPDIWRTLVSFLDLTRIFTCNKKLHISRDYYVSLHEICVTTVRFYVKRVKVRHEMTRSDSHLNLAGNATKINWSCSVGLTRKSYKMNF